MDECYDAEGKPYPYTVDVTYAESPATKAAALSIVTTKQTDAKGNSCTTFSTVLAVGTLGMCWVSGC